jgi:hypothetical protein
MASIFFEKTMYFYHYMNADWVLVTPWNFPILERE